MARSFAGTDRRRKFDLVCRRIRHRSWPSLLAADLGDLPIADTRPCDERGDADKLGIQFARDVIVFNAGTWAGIVLDILGLWTSECHGVAICKTICAGDEGAHAGADRARAS
jgi:hypothetical protein